MRFLLLSIVSLLLLPCSGFADSSDYIIASVDATGGTFIAKQNGQPHPFRVRPDVEVTINGLKATFAELEPGMKVRLTLAEQAVPSRIAATGVRKQPLVPEGKPALGAASDAVRDLRAVIRADSAEGFVLGDISKGSKISLHYLSGKWKSWGHLATSDPDEENTEGGDLCRLVIALPGKGGKPGEVLAIVPANTRSRPFVFEAQSDYPGLILRINTNRSSFAGNPGKAEYSVRILPPGGKL